MKSGWWVVAVALLSSGCCRAARDINKSMQGPDGPEFEQMVKERVNKEPDLLRQLCGVDTRALKDIIIKRQPVGNAAIEARPVEGFSADQAAPQGQAGAAGKPPVQARKLLVCTGVLAISWSYEEKQGKPSWQITRIEASEVTTPGLNSKSRTTTTADERRRDPVALGAGLDALGREVDLV